MPTIDLLGIETVLRTEVIKWATPAAKVNFTTFAAFTESNVRIAVSIGQVNSTFCVWYNSSAVRIGIFDGGQEWKVWKS
jgi:hypothetical protein